MSDESNTTPKSDEDLNLTHVEFRYDRFRESDGQAIEATITIKGSPESIAHAREFLNGMVLP